MELSPRTWPVIACAAALALVLAVGAQASASKIRNQDPNRRRAECFELRTQADGPAVGYASLYRTDSEGVTQLEWQVNFPAEELDIWHVESREAEGQRWVWRERQPRNSRSVVADHVGANLELTEWGQPIVWRTLLPAPGLVCFPLELEERLREGDIEATNLSLFDPLANTVEPVRIEVGESNPVAGASLRRLDLVRDDGSLAGSWTFLGRELVSFRWQRGGLIAVRIDEERYAKRKTSIAAADSAAAFPSGR